MVTVNPVTIKVKLNEVHTADKNGTFPVHNNMIGNVRVHSGQTVTLFCGNENVKGFIQGNIFKKVK